MTQCVSQRPEKLENASEFALSQWEQQAWECLKTKSISFGINSKQPLIQYRRIYLIINWSKEFLLLHKGSFMKKPWLSKYSSKEERSLTTPARVEQ